MGLCKEHCLQQKKNGNFAYLPPYHNKSTSNLLLETILVTLLENHNIWIENCCISLQCWNYHSESLSFKISATWFSRFVTTGCLRSASCQSQAHPTLKLSQKMHKMYIYNFMKKFWIFKFLPGRGQGSKERNKFCCSYISNMFLIKIYDFYRLKTFMWYQFYCHSTNIE